MDEQIPTVTHSGTFWLFGVEARCHRLSDGQTIIEEESMKQILDVIEKGVDVGVRHEAIKFAKFRKGYSQHSATSESGKP